LKTAWALLVVSSELQRENLSDYADMARADAERQGWTLERIEEFKAVASGKAGVRAPMIALVAAIVALPAERRPTWVWMRRVDRVGRGRATESMLALYSLHDLGVRIWDHDTGEVRLDTAEGELPTMLKAWYARLENEIRSGKARAYYEQRRKSGALSVTNKRPYGLRVEKGGQLVPVPGEAEIIQKIFEMRIAGAGSTTIGEAMRLIAPMPLRRDGTPRKSPPRWMGYTIVRMIRNPKYRGTIVDEITWHRAQALPAHLVGRAWNTTPRYPWPLTGAIRCYCGGPLYGEVGGRVEKRWRYYRCRHEDRHVGGKRPGWRADNVEQQFVELMIDIGDRPEAHHRMKSGPSPAVIDRALKMARAELAEITGQKAVVWNLHTRKLIRDDAVQPRLDALDATAADLTARIAGLETERSIAAAAGQEGRLGTETIARALEVWGPHTKATWLDQRGLAIAVAIYFRGLYIDMEGHLQTGPSPLAGQKSLLG
jgi:DNA invertase Pin-like site-specific DNA recombinase